MKTISTNLKCLPQQPSTATTIMTQSSGIHPHHYYHSQQQQQHRQQQQQRQSPTTTGTSSSLSMDRAAFLLIRIKRVFQKKKRKK